MWDASRFLKIARYGIMFIVRVYIMVGFIGWHTISKRFIIRVKVMMNIMGILIM